MLKNEKYNVFCKIEKPSPSISESWEYIYLGFIGLYVTLFSITLLINFNQIKLSTLAFVLGLDLVIIILLILSNSYLNSKNKSNMDKSCARVNGDPASPQPLININDDRNFQIDLVDIQIDESYKTTMLEGIIATVFGLALVSFTVDDNLVKTLIMIGSVGIFGLVINIFFDYKKTYKKNLNTIRKKYAIPEDSKKVED